MMVKMSHRDHESQAAATAPSGRGLLRVDAGGEVCVSLGACPEPAPADGSSVQAWALYQSDVDSWACEQLVDVVGELHARVLARYDHLINDEGNC
jgi:hypothetical protein